MTIKELASKYRLKTREIEGETIVPGKHGEIYEYSEEEFGCMLMTATHIAKTAFWNKMREMMQAKGMTLRQNGDSEGSLSFTGEDSEHVKLAMRLAGVRPKRKLVPPSQKQIEVRARFASRATRNA